MQKNNAVAVWYILFCALAFAIFEFLGKFILQKISIDVYTVIRLLFGLLVTAVPLWFYDFKYHKTNFRNILRNNPKIFPLFVRAFTWPATVVCLGISFQYSTSQTAAYAPFIIHPLWAILIGIAFFGQLPNNKILTAIFVLMMIGGAGIFAWGNSADIETDNNDEFLTGVVFTIGLLGGVFFAATNALMGYLSSDDETPKIETYYVHLFTYLFGMPAMVLLMILMWSIDVPILEWNKMVAEEDANKIDIIGLSTHDMSILAMISIIIVIGIIGTAANELLGKGIEKAEERDKGKITALELVSIPIVTVMEIFILTPSLSLSIISAVGIGLIVLGAFFTSALCAKQ